MKYSIKRSYNLPVILKLHDKCFGDEDFYMHRNNVYWLCKEVETKKPVAFGICTNIGDGLIFLSRVGVLPRARGNRLHRRLIKVREKYAVDNDFETVMTYVDVKNTRSFISLIKLGYEIYTPEYPYGTKNSIYFKKEIKKAG